MRAGLLARDLDKDLEDFKFLLTKMEEMGGSFGELLVGDGEEMGDQEALTTMGREVRGAYEALLLKMLG